jgi:cell division protein FtsQ
LYPVPDGAPEHNDRHPNERRPDHRGPDEREEFDDARLVDLEAEQESPFLRGQKRVSARRGSLPKKTANRLKWVALAVVILAVLGASALSLYQYGKHNWRFRIDSSDQIEVAGAQHVSHAQIMEVMGGDIGRNIFFIPLSQRKQQLEQIPWVESASVMRFVPNRLRIEIQERTPVGFARIGTHISLIDAGGYLMEIAPGSKHKYSFPVITGINPGEPLSVRALHMKNYNELLQELDASGARYSQEISEVDLTDTEDVKVMAADSDGEVLVHLGPGNYLQRYRIYVTHVQAWRQQFSKLDSVDLRYDGQIIVNPDLQGIARQLPLTQAAARAALAAGVKNSAIVNYEKFVDRPAPAAPVAKQAVLKTKVAARADSKAVAKPESSTAAKTGAKSGPKAVAHPHAPKAKARVVLAKHPAAGHAAGSGTTPKTTTASAANSAAKSPAPTGKAAAPTVSAKAGAGSAPAVMMPKPAASAPSTTATQKKPSPVIRRETPQN